MVDKRGFLVSRSHTIAVSMMHRTGEVLLHLHILQITKQCLWHLSSSGRSVWLLRGHGEQRLCAEHAFGQEAGLHDPDHAVPTGASSTPGEDPDQKSGWLLDQQDGEQGSGYFYAQGLSWRQSQLAGKWWCLHLKTVKNRGSATIYLTWIFLFFRNTSQNLAWPRLLTRPRLTCPTSLEKRTCTSPTSTTLHPWRWAWKETPLTPPSSDPTSWETPSSSTSIIPSSSWWRTTRPSPSSTLAEWSDPRGRRCVMSYNVHVLNCGV